MTPQEKNQDIHDVRSMSDLNSHMDLTSTTSSSTSSMNESQYATPPESSAIVPDPSLLVKNNVQWPSTTNTVEAAMSLLGNHQHHEFNQLFNYVNHIDQVEIEAGQTTSIIIAFLPEEKDASAEREASLIKSATLDPFHSSLALQETSDETYDYFEVNGMIFFLCFKDFAKISPHGLKNPASFTSIGDAAKSITRQKTESRLIEDTSLNTPSINSPHMAATPDFQITAKFRSRVCKSVLSTDISSTGLIFDDCIAGGGTYFKDFTVQNRSEIELFWVLNTVDLSSQTEKNLLKFTDYNTGELLDFSPIPAYSHKRIRVSFRPTELGEFSYDLQIENQNDSSNTIQTRILAVVRSVLRDEKILEVGTGNMLEFGDCVAGVWKKKTITLRNVCDSPVEVLFGSDNDSEIVFQLRNDEGASGNHMISGNSNDGSSFLDGSSFHGYSRRKRAISSRHAVSEGVSSMKSGLLGDELSTGAASVGGGLIIPGNPGVPGGESGSVSRGQSELSITRTRSSSSSIDSAPLNGGNEETAFVGDLPSRHFLDRLDGTAAYRLEEMESYSSLDAVSRDTGHHHGEEIQRIEELVIRPGSEKMIDVCYFPGKGVITSDYRACKLSRKNFRIFLTYFSHGRQHDREKNTIQCVARTCTSAIEVSPSIIQFGDTDVGTLKSSSVQLKNCSDLPAIVELRYISKVLSSIRGELMIPPKQSIEVKIDIYPRKVNPDYRKEIVVANLLNSDNDKTIEVRSTNIDQQHITFHSLFYQILTPMATHFLDFGSVVLNSAVVRTFVIENISHGDLHLEIGTSMPSELLVYTKATNHEIPSSITSARPLERKEKLLESIETRRRRKRLPTGSDEGTGGNITKEKIITQSKASSNAGLQNIPLSKRFLGEIGNITESSFSPEYLDLASVPSKLDRPKSAGRKIVTTESESNERLVALKKEESKNRSDVSIPVTFGGEVSTVDQGAELADLLQKIEKETGMAPPHFTKASAEERYVKNQQTLKRELSECIDQGLLVPTTNLHIPPQTHQTVVLIMKASTEIRGAVSEKNRKHDAKVFLKLLEFDRNIKQPQFEQIAKENNIPIRELMLRCLICQSSMELGQKNINFGTLDKTERRTKKIVIRNKSEAPLLYSIRKSGSIASGDILFSEGQKGVVRGFSKREVEFLFDPSLPGTFQEKLTIENVLNPSNDQHLVVKAVIRQQATFHIENLSLNYGACLIDQISPVFQSIVISNPSATSTRMIEVRVDPRDLKFDQCSCEIWFSIDNADELEDGGPKVLMSKETEEKIEQLEQKLKIAIRKGKLEKVEKIKLHLQQIRAGKETHIFEKEDADSPNVDPLSDLGQSSLSVKDLNSGEAQKVKMTENSIIIPVRPRSVKTIRVHFRAKRISSQRYSSVSKGFGGSSSLSYTPSTTSMTTAETSNDEYGRSDKDIEFCSASIYVHEQKNTDVVKKVSLSASVCFDNISYLRCLEEQDSKRPESAPPILDASPVPLFPLPPPALEEKVLEKLNIVAEVSTIDLGKLELGEVKDCYFTLLNPSNTDAPFKIQFPEDHEDMIFYEGSLTGIVSGGSSKRIEFQMCPKVIGRDMLLISVLSLSGEFCIPIRFIFYGTLGSYLNFGGLLSDNASLILSENKSYELDFQFCFVEPSKRYAKVVPFSLENTTSTSIVVTATSNLTQQCLIFRDSGLENSIMTEGLLLAPHESSVIYIALQPGLVASSGPRKNEKGLANDISDRRLIGGIRFLVHVKEDLAQWSNTLPSSKVIPSPDGLIHVFTHSLKFNATIGQSFLDTSLTNFDFGTSQEQGGKVWESGFWISNSTPKMPLSFTIETSSSQITLAKSEGTIEPVFETSSNTETTANSVWIEFTLTCKKPGYVHESIVITNLHNSGQKVSVSIRAFVDPNTLNVFPPTDILKWDNIFVSGAIVPETGAYNFAIQKRRNEELTPTYDVNVDVQNTSDELVHLQAASDLDVNFRWVLGSGAGFVLQDDVSELKRDTKFDTRGPKLLLRSKQKATAVVSVPKLPSTMDEQSASALLRGSKYAQSGILLLRNVDLDTDLKVFNLASNYYVSFGSIEPSVIDLGRVGHFSYWQDVRFQATVQNSAEVALHYEIELPDIISVLSAGSDSEASLKNKISPESSQVLDFVLKPKILESMYAFGPETLSVNIYNIHNPSNQIVLTVKFNVTRFELKFDRLQSGELILPPLTHPSPPNSLPCDNWFSVTNVSDYDVKFDLGCTLSPDVESLVVFEVFSRHANTPITSFTLVPKGSIDLKVRMAPIESSKLTASSPNSIYLTNPDGITLGSFWVSSRAHAEGNPGRIESIPIRGVLVEGKTFLLSEKSLVFKSVLLSDSDDEDTEAKSPIYVEQKQTVLISNPSLTLSLPLKFNVDYPIEFATADPLFDLSPLENMETIIEPGGTFLLQINLLRATGYGLSEDIRISIIDKTSLTKKPQYLSIKFVEDTSGNFKISSKKEDKTMGESAPLSLFDRSSSYFGNEIIDEDFAAPGTSVGSGLDIGVDTLPVSVNDYNSKSTMELKGCKKTYGPVAGDFEGFYELDLGQQDLSPTPLTKKLFLDVLGTSPIPFRVFSVNENDVSWMVINRFDGIVESSRNSTSTMSSNQIPITFNLAVRGSWSTYLVIENLENRLDTKFIRVSLEVVAKQNIKRTALAVPEPQVKALQESNRVFEVSTHALESLETEFNMGSITFGTFYVARSIVIWNRDTVPLDFTLSSNLSKDEDSELIFSLSRTGAKLFSSVRIEPESSCQVFLRFLFNPSSFFDAAAASITEDYIESKNIEIYVNCRLVKDYQKVINFKALCLQRQLVVSDCEYLFQGAFKDESPTIKGTNDVLVLSNTCSSTVEFQINSDSLYFGLELLEPFTESSGSEIGVGSKSLQHVLTGSEKTGEGSNLIWVASSATSRTFSLKPMQSHKFRIVPILEIIEKHGDQLKKTKYIQDHFVVYNKKRLYEKERIYLRISFGHLNMFQFASDPLNHFLILESQCVGFLHQMASCPLGLWDADIVGLEVRILYQYIIDELIHFGTREQAAHRYIRLATLLFKMLFSPMTSSSAPVHKQWVDPFVYFLGFYPSRSPRLDPLKQLARSITEKK